MWNEETQCKFQILLVQYHEYLNYVTNGQTFQKLNPEQIKWLNEKEKFMSYEIAKSIILAKDYVGGPDMRGRQSMPPLRKLSLVYIDENEKVCISDVGNNFINNKKLAEKMRGN